MHTISDVIDVSEIFGKQVRCSENRGGTQGGDHILEGIVVSPNYRLLPETSRIKPVTNKICAAIICCG